MIQAGICDGDVLQASPEFKGIKTDRRHMLHAIAALQASPEFKGIKTVCPYAYSLSNVALQASPEFKGIKTCQAADTFR